MQPVSITYKEFEDLGYKLPIVGTVRKNGITHKLNRKPTQFPPLEGVPRKRRGRNIILTTKTTNF